MVRITDHLDITSAGSKKTNQTNKTINDLSRNIIIFTTVKKAKYIAQAQVTGSQAL